MRRAGGASAKSLALLGLGVLVGLALAGVRPGPRLVVAAAPSDFAAIVAHLDPGVAHVTTRLEGDRVPGSRDDAVGAGFVVGADGLVVTSRHLLRGARQVYVTLPARGTFEARVLGQDEVTDVALLQVPVQGLSPLPAGDPRALKKGQWVLAAGSPFHLPGSWSVGIVSGLGRSQVGVNPKGYEDFIQTDATANLGNSGGPLVDATGQVVGMMTAILSRTGRSQGVSLATPIDVVLETVRRLRGGGDVERPSLGIVVRELDTRGSGRGGLEITRFEAGSGAPAAGLRPGDVVLAVDGTPTARVADLQQAVWRQARGQSVRVLFERQGQRYEAIVPVR